MRGILETKGGTCRFCESGLSLFHLMLGWFLILSSCLPRPPFSLSWFMSVVCSGAHVSFLVFLLLQFRSVLSLYICLSIVLYSLFSLFLVLFSPRYYWHALAPETPSLPPTPSQASLFPSFLTLRAFINAHNPLSASRLVSHSQHSHTTPLSRAFRPGRAHTRARHGGARALRAATGERLGFPREVRRSAKAAVLPAPLVTYNPNSIRAPPYAWPAAMLGYVPVVPLSRKKPAASQNPRVITNCSRRSFWRARILSFIHDHSFPVPFSVSPSFRGHTWAHTYRARQQVRVPVLAV